MDCLKIKMAAAAVFLLALAGCSSGVERGNVAVPAVQATQQSGEASETVTADESNVVCYHEKKIGSNRKSLRCMSKADRDKMQEVSRDAWLRSQKGSETGGG